MENRHFDILIAGGGSAGAVLASRLSEDPDCSVLLVEAGSDIGPGLVPHEIASPYPGLAYFNPRFSQAMPRVLAGGAHWNDQAARPRMDYSQGKALGGGSAINGLGANRGAPSDYDEWQAAGADGWNWENVLPYFRKLERDLDFDAPWHGKDGPLPIRNAPQSWRSGFVNAAIAALDARGIRELPDQNGLWADGVYAQRLNLDERMQRVPTSLGWLTPEARMRPNLTILTGVRVTRIVMEGRRAIGARIGLGLQESMIRARRTIVCAGAFGTPALLMRSGIGPGPHLQARGVDVVRHLSGVGRNLQDHPYAGVSAYLPRPSRMKADNVHHIPAIWRFSSGHAGCPPGDMHMGMIGRVAWHAMGRRLGALAFWVNKSYSRGTVELATSIDDAPEIDLRLLSDDRDRIRLKAAFRQAVDIAGAMAAAGVAGPPQPARLSDRARRYGAKTPKNTLLMGLAAAAVDLSGPFAAQLMGRLSYSGPAIATLLADDAALDRYLDESVTGVWHPCGTCRMGRADDPMAVTGADGTVHGLDGLSVCDASVFPTIPCANLNVPVIMTAERMADLMRAGGK